MMYRFPLKDALLKEADTVPTVDCPLASGDIWKASGGEFSLKVPRVGDYYVGDGLEVRYSLLPGADPEWVQLYLNSQVLVALLHQRGIINFHAGSFIYDGRGVMVLGDTGAGKSSLTVSFALGGAGFLTDDLTPVIFKESVPYIWPLNRDVKLREDTVSKLGVSPHKLRQAEAGTGKQYMEIDRAEAGDHSLDMILKIEVGDCSRTEFHEPSLAEGFSMLRSEICLGEILAGMPATETAYLHQLVEIVERVKIVRVVRPAEIEIAGLYDSVRKYLDRSES